MLSVAQALQMVDTTTHPTTITEIIRTSDALGYVLADDIYAPINMPPFRQSSMDGYALNYERDTTFRVVGEVKTGDAVTPDLEKGEAVRIFTGALVPDTATAVVMQENVSSDGNTICIEIPLSDGMHIRGIGEQIAKGALALPSGTVIKAATIGYLAGLGIENIRVCKKPAIAIIATGNELIQPGRPLKRGQIYESNALMLKSSLCASGFYDVTLHHVDDDDLHTLRVLEDTMSKKDMVLVLGGISVGDYDFVGGALKALEVTTLFYRVMQKPGKPIFYGKKGKTTVFALPGNPASALSCFYIYVLPVCYKMIGYPEYFLEREFVSSNSSYTKKRNQTHFLKAFKKGQTVTILDGQASSMLYSFAVANALVHVPEDISEIKKGDSVEVILLPHNG